MNQKGKGCGTMKKQDLAKGLSRALDLPGEALGEAKLSALSDRSLLLENHGGLLHWSDTELLLRFGSGLLRVMGSGLWIRAMEGNRLALEGKLLCLEWKE